MFWVPLAAFCGSCDSAGSHTAVTAGTLPTRERSASAEEHSMCRNPAATMDKQEQRDKAFIAKNRS